MTIVAVGRNSFLAQEIRQSGHADNWLFLSHAEALANTEWAEEAHCLVNFSFWPGFAAAPYDSQHDIDTKLARIIARHNAHYIMLSSRKVYGPRPQASALCETMAPTPADSYGLAKQAVEQALAATLPPERLSILRMGNIFGFEPGRKTFLGLAMTSLRDTGRISLDMAPETIRDFMDAPSFARALCTIAGKPVAGIYNLGSGFGTDCGRVAGCLIKGFGAGEMVITSPAPRDSFWLDMRKTKTYYKLPDLQPETLESCLITYGQQLRRQG